MRVSRMFGRTLREAPADAETEAYRLILRAGLARQIAAGIYTYLPLGWRVVDKIADILRDEMNRVDGQEMRMPVLVPAELWKETGRWYAVDETLWRTEDRNNRPFVLAMTHEEVITDVTRRDVRSYRQLPYVVYQIQTKVRDEPRPRGGLIRMREFLMKDAYSFHADEADLDAYYPRMYQAYVNIYRRVGVPALPVEADPGMIGGTGSHEFILLSTIGEALILQCPSCGYAANQEIAISRKLTPASVVAAAAPEPELVATPGVKTIEQLESFFSLPADAFLKTVVYRAGEGLAAAIVRGDFEVNEVKLANHLHQPSVRLATDDELKAAGIIPGFVSPVGLDGVTLVVDDAVPERAYIAGANRPDYHLKNVLPGRDFTLNNVTDITLTTPGNPCPRCGHPLVESRGLEIGHTFKLGTKYSAAMNASFLDADGRDQTVIMGCYGIGLDRLLSAIVESNHDEKGIVWPASIAPYQVYLVGLNLDQPAIAEAADRLYRELTERGIEVLYDDRLESAGVKFADADLLGLPLRVTVSPRALKQNAVELTPRATRQSTLVPLADAVGAIAIHEALNVSD